MLGFFYETHWSLLQKELNEKRILSKAKELCYWPWDKMDHASNPVLPTRVTKLSTKCWAFFMKLLEACFKRSWMKKEHWAKRKWFVIDLRIKWLTQVTQYYPQEWQSSAHSAVLFFNQRLSYFSFKKDFRHFTSNFCRKNSKNKMCNNINTTYCN